MQILFIGDLHLDHTVGRKTTLDFFKQYESKLVALANTIDLVVMAGDYFRRQDADNPYREILSAFIKQIKPYKVMMLGQHDRDLQGHILQQLEPFSEMLNMAIVKDVMVTKDGSCTFISHDRNTEALKKKISDASTKYVFGHFNVNGYELDKIRLDSSIKIQNTKNQKFYLGDIHRRQSDGFITYVGSIAPTNIGDIDYDFAVLILDTETGKETWKNLKYNTQTIEIKNSELAPGDYSLTRLIVHIKDPKEKVAFLHAHPESEFLLLEFVQHIDAKQKVSVDFNLNFKQIIDEYLKMVHKESLKDKIYAYLELVK